MNDFASPSAENAPLIRWFWRADADAENIRCELAALREGGFGGLVLWPGGAQIGYLGAEWMQKALWTAQVCAELDLALWLADDWAQPSGSGELARGLGDDTDQPAARSLRFETLQVSRSEARSWQAPNVQPIAAWAVPCGDGSPHFGNAVDLLPHWNDNPTRLVSALGQDVQVLLFQEQARRDVDRLQASGVQAFIASTHEAYRAALGDSFAAVRGFCTSGPPLPQHAGDELPWSPLLPLAFKNRHGYELPARLLSLIAPTGDDAAKVRQDFWQSVAEQLEANWWLPLRAWCDSHGLQLLLWTQPDAEASYQALVRGHADPLPALRAAHRIAVTSGKNLLWTRLAASTAALCAQEPPLIVWPENGEFSSPQERLPALRQLYVQGIGSSLSPATETSQPFAERIAEWNLLLTRWHSVLSRTQPGARLGVLLATRSAWAHFHPQGHRFTRWVWEDYAFTAQLLDELHYDFLPLAEDDFLTAREGNGQLFVGPAALMLEAVVIPGATTLHRDTWRKLEEFVAAGGKVICLGLLPRWSDIGRDYELEQHISQTTLLTISDLYAQGRPDVYGEEPSTGFPITRQNEREGRLACYQPQLNTDRADALLRVRQMMKDCLPAACETQTPDLLFARRTAPDGDVFVLVNSGATQVAHVRLRPSQPGSGALFHLDLWTGETRAMPVWMEFDSDEGGGFSIELALAAGEIRVLEWRIGAEGPRVQRANFSLETYDGEVARGYTTQNGTAVVQVRREGRLRTFVSEALRVPSPLLLQDDWLARPLGDFAWPANESPVEESFDEPLEVGTIRLSTGTWHEQGLENYVGAVDYTQTLALPSAWEGCRVWLELSQLREAVEVWLNDAPCGVRLAPPWRFEVTTALRYGAANLLRLRIWNSNGHSQSDQPASGLLGPARLVAYPVVEIET